MIVQHGDNPGSAKDAIVCTNSGLVDGTDEPQADRKPKAELGIKAPLTATGMEASGSALSKTHLRPQNRSPQAQQNLTRNVTLTSRRRSSQQAYRSAALTTTARLLQSLLLLHLHRPLPRHVRLQLCKRLASGPRSLRQASIRAILSRTAFTAERLKHLQRKLRYALSLGSRGVGVSGSDEGEDGLFVLGPVVSLSQGALEPVVGLVVGEFG